MAEDRSARPVMESALDALGILQGTDKSSLGWDYLRHFERELSPFQDQSINVIEIGVAGGSSLRMWAQYFSTANIVGIDINPNCKHFADGRMHVEIGSQVDPDFLDRVCGNYPPTIVIDDGSHQADHIRFTFEHMFPRLADGGCYIVEDLHFHFSPSHAEAWRGGASVSPQDYLGSLGQKVLAAEFGANVTTVLPAPITASVDRVTFLPRAVVIWKAAATEPERTLDRWEALAQESNIAANWARLARIALRSNGAIDRAERASRMAIALEENNWNYHHILSHVLEASNDFPGACRAAEAALERCPPNSDGRRGLMTRLDQLRRRLQ